MKIKRIVFLSALILLCIAFTSCYDYPTEYYIYTYFFFNDDATEKNIYYKDDDYNDMLMPYDENIGKVNLDENSNPVIDSYDKNILESTVWNSYFQVYNSYKTKPVLYFVKFDTYNEVDVDYDSKVSISYKDADGTEHEFSFTEYVPGLAASTSWYGTYSVNDSVSGSGKKMSVILRTYQCQKRS